MPETLQRPRTLAIEYDNALRYMVPSEHPQGPDDRYLVELDSYGGNGSCCCHHFAMRCEPLLRRRISPREAVEKKLIKLKENRQVNDALRCNHILTARSQFLDEVLGAIAEKRRK